MAESFEPQAKSVVDWLSERTNRDGERVRKLEIARLGKVWIPVGQMTGIYTWQNGYADEGTPFDLFQYQLYDKDHLRVKGAIADSGASGAVGFTFLPPFWPTKDISIWGDIISAGTVMLAVIRVNHTNGQATINWPA